MAKIIIDLNRNLVSFRSKLTQMLFHIYDKKVRRTIELFISKATKVGFSILHSIEQIKTDRAATIILSLLDEADSLVEDLTWRLALKPVTKIAHTLREIIQLLRTQIIFLDQKRQSWMAF